jgi:serine/threonine protein kinase
MDIRLDDVLEGPDGKTIKIDALLGSGGFGQVFSGTMSDSTRVAVKTVITAPLDANELRALQNEAKLALGIIHPNVVRIFYVNDGTAAGRPPYIVMEFVPGGNLRSFINDYVSNGKKIAPDDLRSIYAQIAEGMGAINSIPVHRDLKPDNVLVDSSGRLKIADFGLAKLADAATRTETFKGAGTLPYEAPEVFDLGPNTIAMDVYAAGVMFYELAALGWPIQPPAHDRCWAAWRKAHLFEMPQDLRRLRPDLPMDLVQLVMTMLEKDPRRRPSSWTDIAIRAKGAGPKQPGVPNVQALIDRATSTLHERSAAAARERQEREQMDEATTLAEQAFNELVALLHGLIDAFNTQSLIGRLELRTTGAFSVEVRSQSSRTRLVLSGEVVDDLPIRTGGVAHIIARASLEPRQDPPNDAAYNDRTSFGSFNPVYRLGRPGERYGIWFQVRFEISPIRPQAAYPHWFGVEFDELPRELQILGMLSHFQSEQRPIDDEWFKLLLVQLL